MLVTTLLIFRFLLDGKSHDVKAENEIDAHDKFLEKEHTEGLPLYTKQHGFARWTFIGCVGADIILLLWVLPCIGLI